MHRLTPLLVVFAACGDRTSPPPPAEVIAADQHSPQQVRLHDGYVYWTQYGVVGGAGKDFEPGTISRRKIEGGPIEVVHGDLAHPQELVIANGAMYWIEVGKQQLVRVPLDGGERRTWAADGVDLLVVDGGVAYWTRRHAGAYQVVKEKAGDPQVLADDLGEKPVSLAVANGRVFVSLHEDANRARVVEVVNGVPRVVAADISGPHALAIVDGSLYYQDCRDKSLLRMPLDGKPVTVATFPKCPHEVISDGKDLFVAIPWDGSVWRVRDGGARKLGTADLFAQGLAVDATHVYWANNGSRGSVLRAKK